MRHKAPLSVVDDLDDRSRKGGGSKQKSWAKTLSGKLPGVSPKKEDGVKSYPQSPAASGWKSLPRSMSARLTGWIGKEEENTHEEDDEEEIQKVGRDQRRDAEKSLAERVKTPREERRFEFTRLDSSAPLEGKEEQDLQVNEMVETKSKKVPIGTRLTMTSRVGYFQDRIISPSMVSLPVSSLLAGLTMCP